MSQTILIESNDDLRKLYSLNLSTYAGTDIIERKDANDAISLLKILPSIDLIVTTPRIEGEYTAIDLWKYMQKYELDIPMIVLGDCQEISDKVLTLKSPIDWEILVQHAQKLMGVTEEDIQKKIIPDYVPIESKYFYEITHSPCDIFIRIKKSNAQFDYVKRIHAQDNFEMADIEKYESQGVKEFYVEKDYQQYFVNFVTTKLIQKLESQNLGIEERLNLNSAAYEIVKDHISTAGIDENTTELANTSIKSMITSIRENPKLGSLLKMLLSSRISYAYQHAHLVCVIGNFIMSKQKWYEEKHLDIFSYAAFFSDITLKSINQMRINSAEDLNNAKLTEDECHEVENHALNAAELLVGTEFYTEYLYLVIKQHQGSDSGVGFPDEPSEEIHPIAKCFIVADAFVKIILDPKGPKNKKEILTVLYAQYTNPSYQKIVKVLEHKID